MKKNVISNVLGIIVLSGCLLACYDEQPINTTHSNNPHYDVSKLFTKDGYTVYRFVDWGRYRYFVTPEGRTETEHSSGKTTFSEEIDTIGK